MFWTSRDISDDILVGLHLVLRVAREKKDGVVIENRCLKSLLHVAHVHAGRVNEFARHIKHLFPYQRLVMNQQNATVLVLGMTEKAPENQLCIRGIPSFSEIEREFGFESVTWSCNRTKPQ